MIQMRNITAIIPAAGNPKGIWFPNDQESMDAMVPIAGKPAIFWTLNSIISLGIKNVSIVVKKSGSPLEQFARTLFGQRLDLQFHELQNSRGVGHSTLSAASQLPAQTPTLVVLSDTILWDQKQIDLKADSFVTVSKVEDKKRWCIAASSGGKITRLENKPQSPIEASDALTGIYFFANGITLTDTIKSKLDASDGTLEMSDLLQPLIDSQSLFKVEDTSWLDVGNPDHVYNAHSTLIQSRSFNTLQVNSGRGTITKKSSYTSKFYDEINYYKILPEDLKVFYPRVIASSTEPKNLWIETEFYAYPTLADLLLFQDLTTPLWRKIISQLDFINKQFRQYDYGRNHEAGREIYITKNEQRFNQFWSQAPSDVRQMLSSSNLRINQKHTAPLTDCLNRSEKLLESIAATTNLTPIHGDLCFSNILCEPNRGLMKLIDPRGSFGDKGILGDPRYDLAKIHHSVVGLYDFIVNDLFELQIVGSQISLSFPKSTERISDSYKNIMLCGQDTRDIDLITAWLFLSMLPLHNDSPRRQIALAVRGMQLLELALA